jgi:hypothetical protein
VNWTKILQEGGVPEPPGRVEVLAQIKAEPYVPSKKKAKPKTKNKSK